MQKLEVRGYDPLQKAYALNLKEAQDSDLEKQDRFISRHHIEDEMPPENPGLTSASPEIPLRLFGQLRKERGSMDANFTPHSVIWETHKMAGTFSLLATLTGEGSDFTKRERKEE